LISLQRHDLPFDCTLSYTSGHLCALLLAAGLPPRVNKCFLVDQFAATRFAILLYFVVYERPFVYIAFGYGATS